MTISGNLRNFAVYSMTAALYLIPVELSVAPLDGVLPAGNLRIVRGLRHFVVENLRSARRFLRRWDREFPIDECEFHELNTHTDRAGVSAWLEPLRHGIPMGLMSDAGCPAVADPGADIVAIAQAEGLKVVPLVGPSSILMSLMASGFNGQGFAFNGYVPVDAAARAARIAELERLAHRTGQTQIFIETPYRNNRMVQLLAETLHPETLLCVAADITDPEHEEIVTRTARAWRSAGYNYDKRPAIFLIHVPSAAPAASRKGAARR